MSIERYAFEGSGIEEVVVPETVTKIAGSFANCKSLKRFVFPKNLETIETVCLETANCWPTSPCPPM